MKIKSKFLLSFVIFTICTTSIIGLISLYHIKSGIDLIVNAPNKAFISIMAEKLFFKSLIGYIGFLIIFVILSIFIGMYLFQQISKSFLKTVQKITGLAESRIKIEKNKSENDVLRRYIKLLIDDQKKLSDYDKIKAWKDGARLLIHEIKNPLTPLKLSIDSLMISNNTEIIDDVQSALISITDIENILRFFKDLVNIEYKPIYIFDFIPFFKGLKLQLSKKYRELNINLNLDSKILNINSETNLLKMLIINLINNGIEANPGGFTLSLNEKPDLLELFFTTEDRHIQDIERCFIMGFSQKGKDRGYGLFLCKMIAEFLNIAIMGKNVDSNVVFSLRIKKEAL